MTPELEVVDVVDLGHGLHQIHLREVTVLVELIKRKVKRCVSVLFFILLLSSYDRFM